MQKERSMEDKVEAKRGSVTEMMMSGIVPGKRLRRRPRKRLSDGFDCCQDVYFISHTYTIIHYAIFLCITTLYMRLSIHESYLQLLCIRIYTNDLHDFQGSLLMLID